MRARNPRATTVRVQKLAAADPRIPSVELGELVAVIYRTKASGRRFEAVRHVH